MKPIPLAKNIASVLILVLAASTTLLAAPQRLNSCVVLDVANGKADQTHNWNFELTTPGKYVLQLISPIANADSAPTVQVTINGESFEASFKKSYQIEDGIVWQSSNATDLKAGNHHISAKTTLPLSKARLASEAYEKSRILTSSDRFYGPWLKMHRSPAKQAALARYKQNRFGMFIHWGAYSVAGGSWKGTKIEQSDFKGPRVAEWLMFTFNISREEYRELAKQFNPDKSFAQVIAKLAKDTGMKYVVITAKHHDGFALFDSACSDWDVTDASPYNGDLIQELYDACRSQGLDFGVYYSHGHDWTDGTDANYANVKQARDPLGLPTRPNGKNLWDPSPNSYADYLENKAYPQVAELIKLMPELSLIWFDGEGLITEAQAFRFYKQIFDLNPNIVVNRRIGYDFGDYVDAGDNKTPESADLAAKHFETCGTGNHSWGYKAHDNNWKSTNQLLRHFVDIVSKGGNYLLNIGPDGAGKVQQQCVNNFQDMGVWVKANSEAIFGTDRWTTFSEGVTKVKRDGSLPTEFWFSAKGNTVYVMSLVPGKGRVKILSLKKSAGQVTKVRLLSKNLDLPWTQNGEALEVDFDRVATEANGFAIAVTLEPSN